MPESIYPIDPIDFDDIATYPLGDRKSKVHVDFFGEPVGPKDNIASFIDKLPKILAAEDLQKFLLAIKAARASKKAIIWGIGGHVVKCGLSPIIIDMMRDGYITGIAMNGACAVHDFEVALHGSTSEDVGMQLQSGRFGMARETGEHTNNAINSGAGDGIGIGESLGRFVDKNEKDLAFKHVDLSILKEAYSASIPVTVHLAIGTDINHIHPLASGENLGQGTMRDFKLFCRMVQGLNDGGVYVNLGSAVILPEVFLKAVSVVRNLGNSLKDFTTANLDFIQHYRPTQNVLHRPTQGGGQAIALTGHHEIMLPLIAAALKQAGNRQPRD